MDIKTIVIVISRTIFIVNINLKGILYLAWRLLYTLKICHKLMFVTSYYVAYNWCFFDCTFGISCLSVCLCPPVCIPFVYNCFQGFICLHFFANREIERQKTFSRQHRTRKKISNMFNREICKFREDTLTKLIWLPGNLAHVGSVDPRGTRQLLATVVRIRPPRTQPVHPQARRVHSPASKTAVAPYVWTSPNPAAPTTLKQ